MGFYWSYCPVKLQKFSRCLHRFIRTNKSTTPSYSSDRLDGLQLQAVYIPSNTNVSPFKGCCCPLVRWEGVTPSKRGQIPPPLNVYPNRHNTMITSSLRQNGTAALFWRNNDIITSCARCDCFKCQSILPSKKRILSWNSMQALGQSFCATTS